MKEPEKKENKNKSHSQMSNIIAPLMSYLHFYEDLLFSFIIRQKCTSQL